MHTQNFRFYCSSVLLVTSLVIAVVPWPRRHFLVALIASGDLLFRTKLLLSGANLHDRRAQIEMRGRRHPQKIRETAPKRGRESDLSHALSRWYFYRNDACPALPHLGD